MYQVAENRELKKPNLVHFTKESIKSPYEIRQVGFFSWIGLETPYEHPRTSFLAFSGLTGFLTDVSSENKIFGSQPDFFSMFLFFRTGLGDFWRFWVVFGILGWLCIVIPLGVRPGTKISKKVPGNERIRILGFQKIKNYWNRQKTREMRAVLVSTSKLVDLEQIGQLRANRPTSPRSHYPSTLHPTVVLLHLTSHNPLMSTGMVY